MLEIAKESSARQAKAPGVSCFETNHCGNNRPIEINLISGCFSTLALCSCLPQWNHPPHLPGCYRTLSVHNRTLDMPVGQLYFSTVWPTGCWQKDRLGQNYILLFLNRKLIYFRLAQIFSKPTKKKKKIKFLKTFIPYEAQLKFIRAQKLVRKKWQTDRLMP